MVSNTRQAGLYGLNDAPDDRPKLWWHNYVDPIATPIPAGPLGHVDLVKDWGMLANDRYGCCAWASAAHEVMLQNAANKRTVTFTDDNVLSDYASTGFDPKTGANDNGTNMFQLYTYRKNTGVIDSTGIRHRLSAFLEIKPGNDDELAAAIYLFGVVGIGIKVYDWAEQQFANHQVWAPQRGGKLMGGHAIPIVGRTASGNFQAVTWGGVQELTPDFFREYTTSAFVGITQDYLTGDKSPEGLDSALLLQDLPKLDNIKDL